MFLINNQKGGFTLIELLVVIAIISLLSSVVLASLSTARTKARDAKRAADVKNVQLALEMYYDANGMYPQSPDVIMDVALHPVLVPNYIKDIPEDPVSNRDYHYYTNNATSSQYYAIKVSYENKPMCYACAGDSNCRPGRGFWGIPICE